MLVIFAVSLSAARQQHEDFVPSTGQDYSHLPILVLGYVPAFLDRNAHWANLPLCLGIVIGQDRSHTDMFVDCMDGDRKLGESCDSQA
jgi:hypothetical protein